MRRGRSSVFECRNSLFIIPHNVSMNVLRHTIYGWMNLFFESIGEPLPLSLSLSNRLGCGDGSHLINRVLDISLETRVSTCIIVSVSRLHGVRVFTLSGSWSGLPLVRLYYLYTTRRIIQFSTSGPPVRIVIHSASLAHVRGSSPLLLPSLRDLSDFS